MTCDDWKKFIQVNIYGRTLQDLNRKGIVLETMLNEIGCSNVWIGEAMMYSAVDSHGSSSENITQDEVDPEDISIEPPPVLSTTLATVRYPRFSTPAVSHIDLERRFTLNLPENYSRIGSKYTDKLMMTEETTDDNEVDEVSDERKENVVGINREKEVILSTTVTKIDVPRHSTPINSQADLLGKVTLNIPEVISDIESNDEELIISEHEEESEDRNDEEMAEEGKPERNDSLEENGRVFPIQEPIILENGRSVSSVPQKKLRRNRRLSAPNLKSNTKMEAESAEPKRKRPALSRSTTERKPHLIDLSPKSHSVHLDHLDEENKIPLEDPANKSPPRDYSFEMDYGENCGLATVGREEEVMDTNHHELKPRLVMSASNDLYSSGPFEPLVYSDLDTMKLENSFEQHDSESGYRQKEDISMNMDYGDDEMEANYYSAAEGDETEVMILDDQSQGNYTPPPPGLINTKSILKSTGKGDDGEDKGIKKTVSFGIPKNKKTEKQRKLDETHQIKCHFEDCKKTYAWRPKYGKMRLVDHALSHVPNLELKCESCDHTCKGIRSIRYHHKSAHPGEVMNGFGIRQVVTNSKKDTDFASIWETCFKKNPAIRNSGSFLQLERKDKGIKRPRPIPVVPFDPAVPGTSDDNEEGKPKFHFFRIR